MEQRNKVLLNPVQNQVISPHMKYQDLMKSKEINNSNIRPQYDGILSYWIKR